jgi:hypothetical protein
MWHYCGYNIASYIATDAVIVGLVEFGVQWIELLPGTSIVMS